MLWKIVNDLRDLWDSNKKADTHVIRVAEGKQRERVRFIKGFEDTISENVPDLTKDIKLQIQTTENHSLDESDIHAKTHHNENF